MTYAKIVSGVVTEIIENVTGKDIAFSLSFKFCLHKRIDNLSPVPAIGWHYSDADGFYE